MTFLGKPIFERRISFATQFPSEKIRWQYRSSQAPNNVVTYAIIGEGEAPNYFYINPTTGDITLLQSVASFEGQRQRVSPCFSTSRTRYR